MNMRFLVILLGLLPFPAHASDFVADAFGLFRESDADAYRKGWSDFRFTAGPNSGTVHPPTATDSMLIVVGPKSLVAGKDRGHAVTILLDQSGNLVDDGTKVELVIGRDKFQVSTRGGIADHIFLPAPYTGEIAAGATAGRRQSPRAMVRVVADLGSVTPDLQDVPAMVSPETSFEILTGPLQDRFGNPADDGAVVNVRLSHEDGSQSLATATTKRGRADVRFLSRDIAGPSVVQATLGANTSEMRDTSIARPLATAEPDIAIEAMPSIGSLRLVVGPFLTSNGYALNDGVRVSLTVKVRDSASYVEDGWVRDGYFSAILPIASSDQIKAINIDSPLGQMEISRWRTLAERPEVME